jgi:hypothetical protein
MRLSDLVQSTSAWAHQPRTKVTPLGGRMGTDLLDGRPVQSIAGLGDESLLLDAVKDRHALIHPCGQARTQKGLLGSVRGGSHDEREGIGGTMPWSRTGQITLCGS